VTLLLPVLYKKVACCLMFPSDYPRSLILVELKSKTLAARLLTGLTRVAEDEARKFLGRPQVICAACSVPDPVP
jgi:hypothetical protein